MNKEVTSIIVIGAGEAVTNMVVELRGPDQSVRVRQVRVLGSGEGEGGGVRPLRQHSPLTIQHRACEQETLKVFRLITGQVTAATLLSLHHIRFCSSPKFVWSVMCVFICPPQNVDSTNATILQQCVYWSEDYCRLY